MNPWAIGALAWLAAVITAAALLRWAGKRRDHGDRLAAQTPAPARPRAPEPAPRPGTPPDSPSIPPGPGHLRNGIYGRCVMTTYFFDTGITVTHDHTRMRRLIDIPPADEWDGNFLKDIAP